MTSPLREYQTCTYYLTIQKLQKQALERKTWLDEKLAKNPVHPVQK